MELPIYMYMYVDMALRRHSTITQPTVGQFISCVSVETYINWVLVKLDRSTVLTNNIYSKHDWPLPTW